LFHHRQPALIAAAVALNSRRRWFLESGAKRPQGHIACHTSRRASIEDWRSSAPDSRRTATSPPTCPVYAPARSLPRPRDRPFRIGRKSRFYTAALPAPKRMPPAFTAAWWWRSETYSDMLSSCRQDLSTPCYTSNLTPMVCVDQGALYLVLSGSSHFVFPCSPEHPCSFPTRSKFMEYFPKTAACICRPAMPGSHCPRNIQSVPESGLHCDAPDVSQTGLTACR
jgi:hypothetical protein